MGAISGGAAGFLCGSLLPGFAVKIGALGEPSGLVTVALTFAGGGLGFLFANLIAWSWHPNTPPRFAELWPWCPALLLPVYFLFPDGRLGLTGSEMGPIKYLFSAGWITGAAVLTAVVMPPLLMEFRPIRVAAGWSVLVILISFSMAIQPPTESDEGDYILAAFAISRTATMRVDQVFCEEVYFRYYARMIPGSMRLYQYIRDTYPFPFYKYSLRLPAYPLILAPFVEAGIRTDTLPVRWWFSYFPGIAAYFLLILAMSKYMDDSGNRDGWVLSVLATLTPFLYFATNTQPENWMAALVAWNLYFAAEAIAGRERHAWAVAAATLGMALIHERMAIFAAVFFLASLASRRDKARLILFGSLVFASFCVAYASVLQFVWPERAPHGFGDQTKPFVDLHRWSNAVWAHLVSPKIGVFAQLPALIPVFFARRFLPAGRIALVSLLLYFLLIVTYPHGLDSWPQLRYFVPAFPLLLPALLAGGEVMRRAPYGLVALRVLLALQWAIAWPFLVVPSLWQAVIIR